MSTNSPNRFRQEIANPKRNHQKESGDQHVLPQDEPAEAPHRPHRVNREDMQKIIPPSTEPDDPNSP
jgi:hypothetical protein